MIYAALLPAPCFAYALNESEDNWVPNRQVMTELSIRIPTLKAKALLRDCLQSIHVYTQTITFEIIGVDDHSQDGTIEMLRDEFPGVRLIVSDYAQS